jgi:hypothetical protein
LLKARSDASNACSYLLVADDIHRVFRLQLDGIIYSLIGALSAVGGSARSLYDGEQCSGFDGKAEWTHYLVKFVGSGYPQPLPFVFTNSIF